MAALIRIFKPLDDEVYFEYFDPDGPERSLSFFLKNHAEFIDAWTAETVPETGDSVVVGGQELVVRMRLFEDSSHRSAVVSLLASPPIGEAESQAAAS